MFGLLYSSDAESMKHDDGGAGVVSDRDVNHLNVLKCYEDKGSIDCEIGSKRMSGNIHCSCVFSRLGDSRAHILFGKEINAQ